MKRTVLPAKGLQRTAVRAGLEVLHFTGAHRLAAPFVGGVGAILTFHRVRPSFDEAFTPNSRLQVSPLFLERVLVGIRRSGVDIVSLDEARRRLLSTKAERRFVALTFDDGYRDNKEYAWPLLKRYDAPFTVFITSDFAEGVGELWWIGLETVIRNSDRIEAKIGDKSQVFDCSTAEAKMSSYSALYFLLRKCGNEEERRCAMRTIAHEARIDMRQQCREACMDWDELREMSTDPLCEFGGHTIDHLVLRGETLERAASAICDGAARVSSQLDRPVRHLAYPFGDEEAAGPREFKIAADAGFATAVTTRRGVLFSDHAQHLTALPRLPVNGDMRRPGYLEVFLSGLPTAVANGLRRLNVT